MRNNFLLLLYALVIVIIGGCTSQLQPTSEQPKGPTLTEEPAPPWVKEKATEYLVTKLGKDYVNKYVSFESAVLQGPPEKYIVYFDYNFPYEGDKQFNVIVPFDGGCCIEGGSALPHSFELSEEEAINIAKNLGMTQVDGIRFVFKNTVMVEHDPPNPASKNMLVLDEYRGDYVLEVYVNERKQDKISNVYINSSNGEIIGFYISPDNYKPGDVVSIPSLQTEPRDSLCDWEPGLCKNICQSQNYFFNKETKQCEKYIESVGGGCCTPPPFKTLEDCKKLCG